MAQSSGDMDRQEALKKAKAASEKDVLEELRKNGVNDLDDLVKARLKDLKGRQDGEEGRRAFIYTQFIFIEVD